jgi:hypothetical protein
MVNEKHYPYHRLFVFSLLLVSLLTACTQGFQANIPTDVGMGEIPTSGGFDPGLELSNDYLICPIVPETPITIPPPPYDEDIGDCALRGKSADIETWLTVLEQIALDCQVNRVTNWVAVLTTRDHLDNQIDELKGAEIAPIQVDKYEEDETSSYPVESAAEQSGQVTTGKAPCDPYQTQEPAESYSGGETGEPHNYYTVMLKNIGENVVKFCIMIDELIQPLWQACDEINFYQDCQEPDPERYHSIVEVKMDNAQTNYDRSGNFYNQSLVIAGWEDFRTSFDESSLDCPPIQAFSSDSKFTFYMNTFCRKGPNTQYEKVATFLEGQDVQIKGRNKDEPRWWWVVIPESDDHCWVSDATGSASGELEDLELIQPPPLIIPPSDQTLECSADLGKADCEAAGGHWMGDVLTPYCDC